MTITLDDETVMWARAEAARNDTSVSRFVDQMLRRQMLDRANYARAQESFLSRGPTRKLRQPMASRHARADVRDLSLWDPVQITTALIAHAWTVEDRFGFSWWDSLVVASAQLADATHLLSEDLQDGQNLDGVVVVNPFLHDPDSLTG